LILREIGKTKIDPAQPQGGDLLSGFVQLADSYFEKVVELTKEYVSTPSVSREEKELAGKILSFLNENGIDSFVDDVGNVIGVLKNGDGPTLVFNGHMDTVPPTPEWKKDPYKPTIEEDRLYGLASSDMKGSLAGMVVALLALKEVKSRWRGRVVLTAVVNEEGGTEEPENIRGTYYLCKEGYLSENKADYAVVGEGSVWNREVVGVRIGHNGKLRFVLKVNGIATHSSRPETGINAIYRAIDFINALREMWVASAEIEIPHVSPPMKFKPPLAATIIEAGKKINQVPSECTVYFDRRIVYGEDIEDIRRRIWDLVEEINEAHKRVYAAFLSETGYELHAEVEEYGMNRPAYMLPLDDPKGRRLFDAAIKVVGEATGVKNPPIVYGTGYTDAELLYTMSGIPTILIGAGEMAHCPDEYVNLNRLREAFRSYVGLALELLARQ